jgi:hypothetical protein
MTQLTFFKKKLTTHIIQNICWLLVRVRTYETLSLLADPLAIYIRSSTRSNKMRKSEW